MKGKSKAACQKKHAKRRAADRFGLKLHDHEYVGMVKQIQEGRDLVFLEKQSNRVSFFALKKDGLWLPVIYDKERKTIVTVLPTEALEPYRACL